MGTRSTVAALSLLLVVVGGAALGQAGLSPRISCLGDSSRYCPSPPPQILGDRVVARAFRDVIASRYRADVAKAGLDATVYCRLGMGRSGSHGAVVRRARSRAQMIGLYAESRLVQAGAWKQVASRNDPQHDLCRETGNGMVYAQVKTHAKGSPHLYVSDMRKDYESNRFLIPDDHYEPTLRHLKKKSAQAKAKGNREMAAFYRRQVGRLGRIGASYSQLEHEAWVAAKLSQYRLASARLGWVLNGVLIVPSAYRVLVGYANGKLLAPEIATEIGKGASLAVARTAGAFCGSLVFDATPWRVGGLASVCVVAVQETFLILHYGGFEAASRHPEFYISTAGNIGAAGLGLACTIAGAEWGAWLGASTGPVGAGIGATGGGILLGALGAVAGSYGSRHAARVVLEFCAPDWLYAEFDRQLDSRIAELRLAVAGTHGRAPSAAHDVPCPTMR